MNYNEDSHQCYAVRRLNPFQGVTQVLNLGQSRAISPNGHHWEIQIKAERPDDLWGAVSPGKPVTQFLRFGTWSPSQGLRRIPAHPLLDLSAMLRQVDRLVAVLQREVGKLPFPLVDRFELWLLDGRNRMPLALLASSIPGDLPPGPTTRRWSCAPRNSEDFVSPRTDVVKPRHPRDTDPRPHISALERLIRLASGHTLTQWFERNDCGNGRGLPLDGFDELSNRNLPRDAFPELLLRKEWDDHYATTLVEDYLNWLSPYLLTLQHIAETTRLKLEQMAKQNAMSVDANWLLYPRILDRAAIDTARVEAKIRQSQEGLPN